MSLSEFADAQFYAEMKERIKKQVVDIVEEYGWDVRKVGQALKEIAEELTTCPICHKPFEVVAYGNDYYIVGCMEHREFDKVY
jgi:hypothetical protein